VTDAPTPASADNGQPASAGAGEAAHAAAVAAAEAEQPDIIINIDELTTGDTEDMEAYCEFEVMPRIVAALRQCQTNNPNELLAYLPAKAVSALLGVYRRRQDPTFGPDRWRTIKYAQIHSYAATAEEPPPPPQGKRKTRSATRSRAGSQSPSASPSSAPGSTTRKRNSRRS
jgi:hypothetical protein